ncbi:MULTISPECIES: hypothetical protein [unclassified Curtobacterium]|uniref:hypothetical protein n=1 Tax=unclassified Curtobacterium TaxID=257496 RepID=UPI001042E876|nr:MULTISPECIES: hypothetical protein [unclassified Curtobacterium]
MSNAVKWSVVQLIAASQETSEVCEVLAINRGELERLVRENDVHSFTVDGFRLFPAWQFTEDEMISFVPEICKRTAGMSAAVLSGFMSTVQGALLHSGQALSPRDWLRTGQDPNRVLRQLDSRRDR